MRNITNNIWVGDLQDCKSVPPHWYVVHACKHPCFESVKDTNRLWTQVGNHLYLNMIDSPTPRFPLGLFTVFLNFMDSIPIGSEVLIHCNQGVSRSGALALIYLAKRLGTIPNSSYMEALQAYRELDLTHVPGNGIRAWLIFNWDLIK